jgi:outer membrane protein assembly factor BamA
MGFFQLSLFAVIFAVGTSPMAQAQSSINRPKVAIDVVELEGTRLPKAIQEQLVTSLEQHEWEEDSNWVADLEIIVSRAETDGWPDRENQGYLGFSVRAEWKPIRQERGLLHVLVNIKVDEGQQERVGKIEFQDVGTHLILSVFDSDDLRKLIPLKDGEIYSRDKFYAGLFAVYRAYNEKGFIDCEVTPYITSDQVNQTVSVVVEVNEGPRYHLGNIQVIGLDPKLEALLRSQLTTGSQTNPKLIEDFYRDNKAHLPDGASPELVKWRRDAKRATVDLTFDFRTLASPSVQD